MTYDKLLNAHLCNYIDIHVYSRMSMLDITSACSTEVFFRHEETSWVWVVFSTGVERNSSIQNALFGISAYACIRVHTDVTYVRTDMNDCVHMYMHAYAYVCVHVCMHVHVHVCVCVCVCVCVYVCLCMSNVYVCVYIYIYVV